MDVQRLAHDAADRHAGIERGIGILEDHLHAPPHLTQIRTRGFGQFHTLEPHTARGGTVQLQDGAPGGRLAAARFADQAQGFPLDQVEIQAVHGPDGAHLALDQDPARDGEVHLEIADFQQDLAAAVHVGGFAHTAPPAGPASSSSRISLMSRQQADR